MPLFRRKTDSKLPRTSSISVYGQGKAQAFLNSKTSERSSDSSSFSSIDLEDRPHPLAFAEATYDQSLPMKTKSRLSKNLHEVLHDNAALAYFIQFLDAHKAKHLVKFWLEAESFQSSFETRRKSQSFITSINESDDSTLIKSENVFHGSSQAAVQKLETKLCDAKTVNISLPIVNHKDVLSSHNNSYNSNLCKTEKNLSVDSGCDEKVITNNLSKGAQNCENSIRHELLVTKVNCDKSSDDSLELDQGIEDASTKEEKSELIKDSIVRLETSIEQDAYAIYSKYISCDATFPIGVNEEIQNIIENNLKKSSAITSQCFVPAQEFIVSKMEKEYFPNFLRSSYHCKHQIDVLTSGTVYLADVLYNDSALFFFMEFMEQEGVRHLVDFLLMADNFQKQLLSQENYDGMQAQTDAMVIYEKYFSLQATNPLGFSDKVRFEVEANICREEGPLPDCFLKPVKILTQYLEKTYLLQFLNSQLYFKYISECIIIIQTGGSDSELQQKYPGSDSGSEQSLPISSINTLLAMESKQLGTSKIIKNLDDQDMRIDVMQFKPDALWQRPQAGKLQMAHVDHLGRVTVDFEPEPDKRRESRISKAVKKLVNWDEDKNQEDMAWKVAEMIVKDICSVTMAESEKSTPEKKSS